MPQSEGWVEGWVSLSLLRRVLPAVLFASYASTLWFIGGLRLDLLVFSFLPTVLFYCGPRWRALLQFLLPLCLTALLYDSPRYFADSIRGPIHVREPYEWDKRLFGISTPKGILTPNEWLQQRTSPALDLLTGVAYIAYVPVYALLATYFRFWKSRTGTTSLGAEAVQERSPQITWSFLWVNLLGWSTYYWYAASPPRYVAKYAFGPARLDVAANP